ncbi:MAG: hypothetical protein AB4352_13315 [Hormoscilla sp.]
MVALKSTISTRRRGTVRKPRVRLAVVRSKQYVKPVRDDPTDRVIPTVPSQIASQQQTPNWLRVLIGLERCVSVMTIALGAATLTVYGLTVSSGQQWSRDYNRLQSLQRYERQLRVANEMLKNQMAEQAENPDTDLVPQNPTNTIFLPPASERLSSAIGPVPATTADKLTMPLGY